MLASLWSASSSSPSSSLASGEAGAAAAAAPSDASRANELQAWVSQYHSGRQQHASSFLPSSTSTSLVAPELVHASSSSSSSSSSSAASSSSSSNSSSLFNSSSLSSWFTNSLSLVSSTSSADRTEEQSQLLPSSSSSSSSLQLPTSFSFSSVQLTSPATWFPGASSSSSSSSDTSSSSSSSCFGLSWHQRLALFFMSLTAGTLMLFLSFSFMPLVLLGAMSKFTLSYALANVFFVLSSTALVGPSAQLATMFASQRATISTVYLASLVLVLYASWQLRYLVVLVPLIALQIASLLAYVVSYFPFGPAMMQRLFRGFLYTVRQASGVA